MQSRIVCSGCRRILLYPSGATNVSCAVCNTITATSPPDTAQIICGGCRTLLMYARGATNVRCSCCNTINLVRTESQVAHVNCGQCHTTLMYPYGAPSVKCAICHYVTNIGMNNTRTTMPVQRSSGSSPETASSTPPLSRASSQTVIIENPTSVDTSGKPVNNVVVGVTTARK